MNPSCDRVWAWTGRRKTGECFASRTRSRRGIETYCAEHPGTCAMVLSKDGGKGRYARFGPWEKLLELAPARAQGSPAG